MIGACVLHECTSEGIQGPLARCHVCVQVQDLGATGSPRPLGLLAMTSPSQPVLPIPSTAR